MTSPAPLPTLTRFDRLVLGYLQPDAAVRLSDVVAMVRKHERRYLPGWRRSDKALTDEVRTVLRGLEHLGLATSNRGWWRARS